MIKIGKKKSRVLGDHFDLPPYAFGVYHVAKTRSGLSFTVLERTFHKVTAQKSDCTITNRRLGLKLPHQNFPFDIILGKKSEASIFSKIPGCLLFIVSRITFLASFNPRCGPMQQTVLPKTYFRTVCKKLIPTPTHRMMKKCITSDFIVILS